MNICNACSISCSPCSASFSACSSASMSCGGSSFSFSAIFAILVMNFVISSSLTAPVIASMGFPSKNATIVGIDCILSCALTSGYSSIFILTSFTFGNLSAVFFSIGSICLHGSHHGAQKSTITGVLLLITSFVNSAVVISGILFIYFLLFLVLRN